MFTKEQLSDVINKYISELEYPKEPEKLYSPIAYSLEGGGKRIRPLLVLMAANIFTGNVEKALPAAAAIEMFHNFTLLHDDIMDNADVRRGKPSVHRNWNSSVAILSGDAMVICSYKLLQQTPSELLPQVIREFNKLAIEVCEGQQHDIDFESREDVALNEYMNMIKLKTAVLMAGATKIGAIIGGADTNQADILYRFGLEMGLAYQLQDDYLDTYGTPEELGKTIGGDIAESKKTFLTINALAEAGDATRRAMLATLKEKNLPLDQKISRIRTIYNSLDIPNITKGAVADHLRNATEALNELHIDAQKLQPLKDLILNLENRNK